MSDSTESCYRRAPPSLLDLSKARLVHFVLESIRCGPGRWRRRNSWLPYPFRESKTYRRHWMRQLGTYLSTLPANLFNQLALELFRVDHPTAAISSLEAILHPLLKTLEVNSKSLGLVLDYAYSLTNVTTLYLFFDISRHQNHVPKLHSFVGSLRGLTHLKMSNCCTDSILGVIGANCKNLVVLDAEEDSEMTVTDHGLAFLVNCSKLTRVILNDAGDEYDYEDRYFGITGKGVANLLISLPNLTHLVCEPYLLREALRFVELINVNSHTYKLAYLHIKFPDSAVTNAIRRLCPDVKELVLEDQGPDVAEVLPNLEKLEILRLENFSWHSKDVTPLLSVFARLTKLVLKNPKQVVVDKDFIIQLGHSCPCLQTLSLTLYQPDAFTKVHTNLDKVRPFPRWSEQDQHGNKSSLGFFPVLEALTLDGDISIWLIESLLTSINGIKNLGIFIHDLGYPSGQFDTMILRLTRDGRLASLRSVTCFQWRVSLETMLFLIDQCCQLNTIFGLDLLMLCPESISIIQEHITRNNRDITLRDASLLEKTSKGIPFLSERSRHRLEAADQISEDDRLEHILKEGTLEDLLKEVKHYY